MKHLTFILLPGMIGTADLFVPLLKVIPKTIQPKIITYPTDTFLDYPSVLKFIERQIVEEQSMILIGESYSGGLALMVAAAHPDQTVAVILSGAYVSPPWPSFFRYLLRPILLKIRMPSFIIRFFAAGKNASDEFVAMVRGALAMPAPDVMIRRAREALTIRNIECLLQCKSPILYLAPDQDRLVPRRNLREILKLRSDVKVQSIGGPHLILQTAPSEAWAAIEAFLGEISTT